jgi:hypothetical protein
MNQQQHASRYRRDDYLGEQEIDLWSDQDLPGPADARQPDQQRTAGGVADLFTPNEIEALVRTAGEAVNGQPEDLSTRQHELADRVWQALHDDTASSTP